jgi:hypothetical protein
MRRVQKRVLKSRQFAAFLLSLALIVPTVVSAQTMPLAQVHKGMKGYGVTVFEGTKLEKFDVEILGVLNNIGPNQDLILARVDHPVIARAGVIAGMSGSPIYIDGKVIGALSYGWNFAKEPVAGITPIDEMLRIPQAGGGAIAAPGAMPLAAGTSSSALAAPRMTAVEFLSAFANSKTVDVFDKLVSGNALGGARASAGGMSGVHPIAVPLSLSSFAPETVERFGKYLDGMGFVSVASGSTSTTNASTAPAGKNVTTFAPGDAIGAVLLSGDFNVAATGTVTYVDGKRVYAFGHPFLDMGEISFPMARSEVVTVLPSLSSSFKFANTGETVGALSQDRSVGIMGYLGAKAEMIPVELTLDGAGRTQVYRVQMIRHPQLSPMMLAMAADSVVSNAQRASGERTVIMESEIKLKGFEPIRLRDGWAGAQARQSIPAYLAVLSQYLMSNEFKDAEIETIKLHIHHDDQLKTAKLLEASVETPARGHFSPGDVVKLRATLKPFRGEAFTETFDVTIPDNQNPGPAYLLIGSGSVMNQIDFSLVPPDPRTLEQVVAVLQRLRPSTELTAGLYSSSEGAVTAGVYLPNLPPTMRAVVAGDTSNGAQASVKYHPAEHIAKSLGYIVDGALKIDLDVKPRI